MNENTRNEEKSKGAKYPKQCWSAQNTESTLSLEMELSMPEKDGRYSPLTMHGLYSRFKLVMILPPNQSGKRDVIYYNIRHTDEIAHLIQQYKTAKLMQVMSTKVKSNTSSDSPAYTVVFSSGNKKGKTAAQFLAEGGSVDELKETAEFYRKKLSQYPNNQSYIDAIDDALFLYETGQLNSEETNVSAFVLIDERNKYMDTTKRDLKITCVYGDTYPWKIDIAFHKVKDGKVEPGTTIKGTYSLSNQQMDGLMYTIESMLNAYIVNNYVSASAMADNLTAQIYGESSNELEDILDNIVGRLKTTLLNALKQQ